MITPNDLSKLNTQKYNIEDLEQQIDKSIQDFHGWHPWEVALLRGEIPLSVRMQIAQNYCDAGWNYVYHITSSENGERPGLTEFYFSMEQLGTQIVDKHHCVSHTVFEITNTENETFGQWISEHDNKVRICNQCGYEGDNTCNDIDNDWLYCPNCGMKMHGANYHE